MLPASNPAMRQAILAEVRPPILSLSPSERQPLQSEQTRTMLEANAFEFLPRILPSPSVRSGQVPVIENPAAITNARNVSQPVLAVPPSSSSSDCLKTSVVDRHWEQRVTQLSEPGHCSSHAFQKKPLRSFPSSMTIWCGN